MAARLELLYHHPVHKREWTLNEPSIWITDIVDREKLSVNVKVETALKLVVLLLGQFLPFSHYCSLGTALFFFELPNLPFYVILNISIIVPAVFHHSVLTLQSIE